MVGSLRGGAELQEVQNNLVLLPPVGVPRELYARLQDSLKHPSNELKLVLHDADQLARVHAARQPAESAHENDEVLSTVGPAAMSVPLSRKSFSRLRLSIEQPLNDPEALYWDDEAVNAGAHCLNADSLKHGSGVHVFPSLVTTRLLGYDTVQPTVSWLARVVRKQKVSLMKKPRAWLFPRNWSKHWTGPLIAFAPKLVLFTDSMGGSSQECQAVVYRLCCFLEVAWQELYSKSFDFTGWSCGSVHALCGKQPNGHDCALFPLTLARCLHHNVKMRSSWSVAECDDLRNFLTWELLDGQLHSNLSSINSFDAANSVATPQGEPPPSMPPSPAHSDHDEPRLTGAPSPEHTPSASTTPAGASPAALDINMKVSHVEDQLAYLDEQLEELGKVETNLDLYVRHLIRKAQSSAISSKLLEGLKLNLTRFVLIVDYKAKPLPGKNRETQTAAYGKKGMSLWGATAIRWDGTNWEVANMRVACDDSNQTWFHTLNCFKVTFGKVLTISEAWSRMTEVAIKCDGANNFTCTALCMALPRLALSVKLKITDHAITEVRPHPARTISL